MKKRICLPIIGGLPLVALAQADHTPGVNMEVMHLCSILITLALFMVFIVAIIRKILDYRIKKQMVEKGIPPAAAATLLQSEASTERQRDIKWLFILLGTGCGLLGISLTQPLGVHSLAILVFSIAGGYLLYLRYTKRGSAKDTL